MTIWRCDNAIIALLSCLEVWMIHFVHRMLSIHKRKEGRFYFLLFILSVPNIFSFSSSPELLRFCPLTYARSCQMKIEIPLSWLYNWITFIFLRKTAQESADPEKGLPHSGSMSDMYT